MGTVKGGAKKDCQSEAAPISGKECCGGLVLSALRARIDPGCTSATYLHVLLGGYRVFLTLAYYFI